LFGVLGCVYLERARAEEMRLRFADPQSPYQSALPLLEAHAVPQILQHLAPQNTQLEDPDDVRLEVRQQHCLALILLGAVYVQELPLDDANVLASLVRARQICSVDMMGRDVRSAYRY
jgi:hypothetical protein